MLETLLWALHELVFLLLVFLPILLLLSSSDSPIDLIYLAQTTTTTLTMRVRPARRTRLNLKHHAHLITKILVHSDTRTLQAFRLTCRRLHHLATALLAQHVTLTDEHLQPSLPFVPQYPGLIPGWSPNLAQTRVLDIQYSGAWHPLIREVSALLPRLPALQLVRIHNSVRELDLTLARRDRRLLHNPTVHTVHFHDLACDIRPVLRGRIPYGEGDVFVNLRHSRVRPPAPPGSFDGGPGPSGHRVYLFLTLAGAAGTDVVPRLNRAGAPAAEAWRALLPYLVGQVVKFIVNASSENTYLFVGDAEDDRGRTHAPGTPGRSVMTLRDRDYLGRLLTSELLAVLEDGYFPPQPAKNRLHRQVGYATFEDIQDVVGPELFPLIMAP
ncbi:hypothetical protein CspeluHIS016_0300220 [Cutaneotrichosporon spelunceum]|uniref:F-box domain-containing protein n=1 Tax=Cutaneotrichosporon spelunceum TaxID=1672016 RepID=A0AAD3YBR4_9TREE|nr:hypothetical protein CspeluHIS016_0300220 [Cutaneotrichosporon spelunceum]